MVDLGKLLSDALEAGKMILGARSQQERELRSMGTRELCDLGIGASEIPYLLQETDRMSGNIGSSTVVTQARGNGHGRNNPASLKQVLVLQQ